MDFSDAPAEAKFRAEARSWLHDNAPTADELAELDDIEQSKFWQLRKYEAGWACITWPSQYGGRAASPLESVIWHQEESRCNVPKGIFEIGIGMAAPTLMSWATESQKQMYLPMLASGEHIWCQLFSEPDAGSDLAGIKASAIQSGDHWIVNGQKIWTSGAQYSDFGILVVRSDPNVPKHRGLTYFFVDMKSPGIEMRPIKQISGASDFNEVFFHDVKIPDDHRLGDVGQGWEVALTTLMHERAALSGYGTSVGFADLYALVQAVAIDDSDALENSLVRAKLADYFCRESGLKYTRYRALTALSRGEIPGPENSIGKYVGASMVQELAAFALDLLEFDGVTYGTDAGIDSSRLIQSFLSSPGGRIAGGTDEILLNILAERVLGLPVDLRIDKEVPFSKLRTS